MQRMHASEAPGLGFKGGAQRQLRLRPRGVRIGRGGGGGRRGADEEEEGRREGVRGRGGGQQQQQLIDDAAQALQVRSTLNLGSK